MVFNGHQLLKKNENDEIEKVDAASVVDGAKVLLVYFSAHWCPPCRGFTPILKDFYQEVMSEGVVIIFVSSDRDEQEMLSYFKEHGGYYAVPFDNQELIKTLKTNCVVSGIPKLCLVKPDGTCVDGEIRSIIQNDTPEVAKKKMEEKLA